MSEPRASAANASRAECGVRRLPVQCKPLTLRNDRRAAKQRAAGRSLEPQLLGDAVGMFAGCAPDLLCTRSINRSTWAGRRSGGRWNILPILGGQCQNRARAPPDSCVPFLLQGHPHPLSSSFTPVRMTSCSECRRCLCDRCSVPRAMRRAPSRLRGSLRRAHARPTPLPPTRPRGGHQSRTLRCGRTSWTSQRHSVATPLRCNRAARVDQGAPRAHGPHGRLPLSPKTERQEMNKSRLPDVKRM